MQPPMEQGARGGLHGRTFTHCCAVKMLGHESPGSQCYVWAFFEVHVTEDRTQIIPGKAGGHGKLQQVPFHSREGACSEEQQQHCRSPTWVPGSNVRKVLGQFSLQHIFSDKQR